MEYLVQAVLDRIDAEMKRLYWNLHQEDMDSPFENTGNSYVNDTFSVHAYYWGDDESVALYPNFRYKDFECYWYKHSHRGLVWSYKGERNVEVPSGYLAQMLDDCFMSMRKDFGDIDY